MGTLMVDWTIGGGLETYDRYAKDRITQKAVRGNGKVLNPFFPLANTADNEDSCGIGQELTGLFTDQCI
jgi:hypothetical protein